MAATRIYVGSIDFLRGCCVTASWQCSCTECQSRTSRESFEEPRACLAVDDGTGWIHQLMHARRESIEHLTDPTR